MSLIQALPFKTLLLAAALIPVQATSYPWWGFYNSCAWSALDAAVPSDCASNYATATECLCGSASFLSAAGKGIGAKCGCEILEDSAATAVTICQGYRYTMALDATKIVAAGQPCSSTSTGSINTSDSPTTSITASAAAGQGSGGGNSGGLSAGATAGISVASLVVAIVGLYFAWLQLQSSRRRRRSDDEATTLTADRHQNDNTHAYV